DGTNWFTVDGNEHSWEDGEYEIPHNFDKDANRIWIREGAWGSFDPDYPYGDFASFDYTWTKVSGDTDLSDIWGQQTSELSFTVSNAHEDYVGDGGHNTEKSYTWNLLIDSRHPWRVYENPTTNALDGTTYYAANGVWVEEDHGHSDDGNLEVTIYPEPNEDPIAADARDLPRIGDGKSVVTSDDYDNIAGSGNSPDGSGNDFNDYEDDADEVDGADFGVWYEPHDNNIVDLAGSGLTNYFAPDGSNFGNNNADLFFTAYDSDDGNGSCDVGGPPTCA
ncbi:uncharacterized protein METZ01_LOCUS411516, partial [marine metagenome]